MRQAGGMRPKQALEGMRRAEGFAVVSASWLLIAGFAGIPYMRAGLGPIDATFEACRA